MSRAYFHVGPEDRQTLVSLAQTGTERMAVRAQIVLLSARALTVEQIATALSIVPPTVYKWRKRFSERGISGLYDLPRPGQPLKLSQQRKQAMLRLVTEAVPDDALGWSIRRLAKAAGVTEHQARSVLSSNRCAAPVSTADLTINHPTPPRLCIVCVAHPIVGAVVLVEGGRAGALLPATDTPHARLARYRNEPESLYRAFRIAESEPSGSERGYEQLLMALLELHAAAHPSQTLDLIAAPARALSARLPDDVRRVTRVVALESVSIWLSTVESYLLWLEDKALASKTVHPELTLLRSSLARHNAREASPSHTEFLWKSPLSAVYTPSE
jgi:transposase-like protein